VRALLAGIQAQIGGEYVLEASDGSSGVWVNDKRCTNTVLQDEDTIRFGKTEMTFKCES
jgi:pSer/pThr/pTyr-binding forkhead associated (FHA) protein